MKSVAIAKHFILITGMVLFTGCATYKAKYSEAGTAKDVPTVKEVSHTFYLVGDAGLSPMGGMNKALKIFKDRLDTADKNSTAIFLGDNIYPAGMPDPKDSTQAYLNAKNDLDAQIKTVADFKGKAFFVPGNHDWYTQGLVGLKREQKYIQKQLDSKEVFFPEDGCPMKTIKVNDKIVVIALDTEWYLTNWNKRPDINDNCEIKDREKLFEEIEGEIKKNEGKTIVMAFHHPMFSYGSHGGQYSIRQNFYPTSKFGPAPFLGTLVNVLRRTAGASIADIQNKRYTELKNRLVTLAQYSDKVIFVSGHEHTLQYIVENSTPQIVSGSGAKKGWTRLLNGSEFSTGQMGYATMEIYTDGSSKVRFYGVAEDGNEEFLFTTDVFGPDRSVNEDKYDTDFPVFKEASIYSGEEIDKSNFFKGLWGERYREYYGKKVTAPVVNLDTLMGGLVPVRKGGGHQSKSLRLQHKNGKQYVMRALRKESALYLQAMVFQDQYLIDDLEDSYLREFLMDFYTGAHPYAPFTVGRLSDAIGVYHTNPKLYYVPKQPALEDFNISFGDELYMIEEHAGDGHGNLESFGFSDKLRSTDEMLDNLRDDEKYEVVSDQYLRARLFDMVLGDWDRHVDQWRWAEFKIKNSPKIQYRPVPRDRDMVFSDMGDGFVLNIATRIIPSLRIMEGYQEEIRNVSGFNSSPKTYVLDVALLSETKREEWLEQAEFIQENLKEEDIDEAFLHFPEEVRDETVDRIKKILISRIENLKETAETYYKIINKYPVVKGTDKDDWFEIAYNGKQVNIEGYRIIDGKKAKKFYDNTFDKSVTKEIWVYGLDDDDKFRLRGKNDSGIKIRLIGGQNNDIYEVDEGKDIYIYDYESKKNTLGAAANAKVRLTDDYEVNTYRPLKFRSSTNQVIPTVGFNPDDGIKLGISNTYTFNGFRQNPFTQQHHTALSYYFATSGFELDYRGEFANITDKANLEIAARLTSPNFAVNFFGFGNETENTDETDGFNFNRVRLRTLHFAPSVVLRGPLGSKFRVGVHYEMYGVDDTPDRFINGFYLQNGASRNRNFLGADAQYTYENADNKAFPTMGMATSMHIGYKAGVGGGGSFGYLIPSLSFDYKLSANGRLVLATKWKAHLNIGNGFEFYQGASIGGVDGLRGFRNQRFTGKRAYYQNTDIRLSLGKGKTGILPTALGLYGSFDYGRVWESEDPSNIWHTSYGGGFFLNMADLISARAALFNSVDGLRFTFGLGFGF